MAGQSIVTLLAGKVNPAAFHLDGDDIQRAVVMGTASLGVEIDSKNARTQDGHGFRVED
jgi:hypothetical protein